MPSFPRRKPPLSIPPLPSIYTSFPLHFSPTTTSTTPPSTTSTSSTPSTTSPSYSTPGLELVPLERSNTSNGKILSPITDEKEVVVGGASNEKPLPCLPRAGWRGKWTERWWRVERAWEKLGVRWRMAVLFAVQGFDGGIGSGNKINNNAEDTPPRNTPSIPIQQGTFTIELENARQQSSTCLSRANESASWACSTDQTLQLIINTLSTTSSQNSTISIIPISNNASSVVTKYGQLPLSIPPVPLTPSADPETPQNGLAYHFKTQYNRTVLLSSSSTTASTSSTPDAAQPVQITGTRAGGEGRMISPGGGDQFLQEGDEPWLCHFNETIVEGYIYVALRSSSVANVTVSNSTSTPAPPEGDDDDDDTPALPYTFKLVEMRRPNSPLPYCEKMRVRRGGGMEAVGKEKMVLMPSDAGFSLDGKSGRGREGDELKGRVRSKSRRQAMAGDKNSIALPTPTGVKSLYPVFISQFAYIYRLGPRQNYRQDP
ncbi:hypothetical protein DM02DRAFT_731002 [Periconia macrospinosa]|uniref:DUF7820 domain-containing protein n=1 Tax=Periconia macrospinosa TaxID=97972 RepID=A0A2V1DF44_9PLEO|nr:hypothetical protein DM02DRAFT_731002 [Periconia macrospinosa]